MNLNKDGGNRKFILVEMEDYAENITAERVRRVMSGYGEGKNAVAGTGGAFDYYELGASMFDKEKNLNEEIDEEKIREYIYYTETNIIWIANVPRRRNICSIPITEPGITSIMKKIVL